MLQDFRQLVTYIEVAFLCWLFFTVVHQFLFHLKVDERGSVTNASFLCLHVYFQSDVWGVWIVSLFFGFQTC